jgi:hypothetical protein
MPDLMQDALSTTTDAGHGTAQLSEFISGLADVASHLANNMLPSVLASSHAQPFLEACLAFMTAAPPCVQQLIESQDQSSGELNPALTDAIAQLVNSHLGQLHFNCTLSFVKQPPLALSPCSATDYQCWYALAGLSDVLLFQQQVLAVLGGKAFGEAADHVRKGVAAASVAAGNHLLSSWQRRCHWCPHLAHLV